MTVTEAAAAADTANPARRRLAEIRLPLLALGAAALLLAALAIALPCDHDEGQYLAAAALSGRLRPYADFVYLQTPLQPHLTALIAALAPGWAFVALRLFNAAIGVGVLALAYASQRRLGVPAPRALIACGLLLAAYPFQFSSVVARNDALPALLEAAAMLAGLEALAPGRARWLGWTAAGLLLGAAASAKISYAFPLAATGLYLLWGAWRRRLGLASLIGCGLGAAAGLLPSLLAYLSAPEGFVWGVLTYAETAPKAWYSQLGEAGRLSLPSRAMEGAFHLGVGPLLGILAGVVLAAALVRRGRAASPSVGYLQALALAGLAAAFAPSPMQRQYLLPMLPPLIVLWGAQDPLSRLGKPSRQAVLALVLIGLAIGLGRAGYVLGEAGLGWAGGRLPPALALEDEAHWIGRTLAQRGPAGPVATLSPRAVLDSGAALDPRFAAGAFAYRTGDLVPDAEQRRLHMTSPRTLASDLDATPPAALVTGYEQPAGLHRRNVDDDLRAYARSRGYQRRVSPDGVAELWLNPLWAASPAAPSPSRRPGS
ncbi:MAG TPA: phospholipid carrier-dependent glycosyltransferase [Caulobacteraceae bacterium]